MLNLLIAELERELKQKHEQEQQKKKEQKKQDDDFDVYSPDYVQTQVGNRHYQSSNVTNKQSNIKQQAIIQNKLWE